MIQKITPILIGGLNGNCYLLTTEKGFVLIDAGRRSGRKHLEQVLSKEGCKPGTLDLVIVTHGDFDHTGNCRYLHDTYHTNIAMHRDDAGMVEHGDMFWNRQTGNVLMRKIINVTFSIPRFTPDVFLDEDSVLSTYGLNAKILHLPGHTQGSIGVLTSEMGLFCGDLFTNTRRPELTSLVDNVLEMNESLKKIKNLGIRTVYPGHGSPFQMKAYQEGIPSYP